MCPVIVNRYVAPLMQAGFGETLAERLQAAGKNLWRGNPEIADHRHRRLLPARRERPCCRAEQRDELAPSHSITSSARASSVGGTSTPSARAVGRLMTNSNLLDCT